MKKRRAGRSSIKFWWRFHIFKKIVVISVSNPRVPAKCQGITCEIWVALARAGFVDMEDQENNYPIQWDVVREAVNTGRIKLIKGIGPKRLAEIVQVLSEKDK